MFTKFKRKLCITLILIMSLIAISVTALLPTSKRVTASSTKKPTVTFIALDGTTQTVQHANEGYDKLVDGEIPRISSGNVSKWCLNVPENGMPEGGFYVVLDAYYRVNISKYTLYTANDNSAFTGRNPKDWILYGSNDYGSESSTWTTIHTVTDDTIMKDTNSTGYDFGVENNTGYYRYYKFVVNSIQSGNVFQLGEMEFDFTLDPNEFHYELLDYTTDTATSALEGPEKIFDGRKSAEAGTKWCTKINDGVSVTFKTSKSVKVNGYKFTTGNDNTTNTNRNPVSWTLSGSSDYNESTKTGTWQTIDSVTDDTTMADENYTTYAFNVNDNATSYQYYKLEITKNKAGTTNTPVQISEFELSYPTCTHSWVETSSVPATCTTAKQVTSTCSLCQDTKTESVGSPNDHSWSTTSIREATCTLPKRINQTCLNCSETQTITDAEAYGHSYLNGYCTRCHKQEDGVTVGAFVVTGGTLNTDYKYENDVLTILTSTPLTIANADVTTATTADRIYIAKDVSANITLAGVNIDKSMATYQNGVTASTVLGVSALEIADDSKGNVVITLAENTVNTLRSGLYAVGLQKNGLNGTLLICGKGKLIAYGGQDGAGIGAGDKYDDKAPSATVYANNITIVDCVVEAYASRLSNGEIAEEGFNTSIAVGIGTKSLLPAGVKGNISIINATVTVAGQGRDYAIGHCALSGHFENVVVEGGSVKCIDETGIVDMPINVNGNPLYLLTLSNPNGGIITIDGRYYTPYTHSATDTNIYAYLSGENHSVWVGDTFKLYSFNSETSAFEVNDTVGTIPASEQPKALTITAKSDNETLTSSDYTYTDGILTVTTTKEVVITSFGIKTTDRIAIATDDAKVTLNDVVIDVSATTDACALEISVNGVTLTLNEGSVNILKSGSNKPGLSFSVQTTVSNPSLTINGEGTLYAYGGKNGAGIGSGNNADGFTIQNANIYAYGGDNGAGIGSGNNGKVNSNITITNAVVIAVGGKNGAGIGSGKDGTEAKVVINGSVISATGGNSAAGIGSGKDGASYTVNITNSTVLAVGGNYDSADSSVAGAGIGNGTEGTVTISGSSVNAIGGLTSSETRTNAIGGGEGKEALTPTDGENALYLLTISNPDDKDAFIDDSETKNIPNNSSRVSDSNLYLYLTGALHSVTLGETTTYYCFNSTTKTYHVCVKSTTLQCDDDYHWYSCTVEGCSTQLEKTAHVHDQQVVNATYLSSDATCTEAAKYYYSCECGYKGTATFDSGSALDHDFDMTTWAKDATHHYHACKREGCNAYDANTYGVHDYTHDCDADCNTCGYLRAESSLTHNPSSTWTYNDSTHYKTCTRKLDNDTTCGAVCESVAHTYSKNLYYYENGKHYRECDSCDYHDASTEQTCNNTVVYDSTYHYEKCSVCAHVVSSDSHTFTNACDTTCNYTGCKFVRTITHDFSFNWSSDTIHHWHACNVCGEPDNKLTHDGLSTIHYGEDEHWYQCTTCLTIVGKEKHVYDDEHDFTCNECPFYTPQKIGSLKFTYSGYVVNGNTTAFKVLSDTSNVGLEWDNDYVYDYYWWIITDIDKHLTDGDDCLWGSLEMSDDTILTLNNSLRPNVDYWVGIWLHPTKYYEFENITCNDIYIEGLGYALHLDVTNEYADNKEVCAYFKLPKLTGESNVQTVPQLTFDVGNYQVGNDVLDLTLTPSSSNTLTVDYYCEYPLIDHSCSYEPDWYNGKTFSADHGYSLNLIVCAPHGYDFNDFDIANLKIMVGDEVCTVAYYEIYSNGAFIDLTINLPTLKENHVHDYEWRYNDSYHWQECSCGNYNYLFASGNDEHVYDDAHDETCNDCGYVRPLSATGAQFSLSGYAINGATSSLNFAPTTENTGFIIERLYMGFSCDDKLVNSTIITPSEKCYFLNGNTYWVVAMIKASTYGENKTYYLGSLTAEDFTIPDVCSSAYAIMATAYGDEAILIFKLPALQGENQIPTVGNSQFTLGGYELNGLISSASLTQASTNTGFSILNFKITKNGSVVNSATETFNSDDSYGFTLTLCAEEGYTFMGVTKDTFNVIGAYELIETSFSAGYGSVTLRYSLLKLKGEHNHAYTIDKFNETHHWQECVCGAKQNVTAHSYSNETDTTCERCSHVRNLPVQTIIIRLDGYLYAHYVEDIILTHSSPYINAFTDYGEFGNGHSYCLGTGVGIGTSLDYTSLLYGGRLKANTDYYLGVRIAAKSTYDFSAFTTQNVKLELNGEYLTPTEWLNFGTSLYQVTFKLPKLITAHVHDCVAVDAVAPTCVSKGNIAHALCQTCGKYFDDKGLELDTVTVAIDPDAHAYTHKHGPEVHWEQCTLCNHVKDDSSKLHVYDDALDCSCNVCSYVRETPVTNVTLTLNGYVVDGIITNITVGLDASTVGIAWENTSYTNYDYVIITDFNAHFDGLIQSNRDDFFYVVTDNGYFLPNTAYWLAVRLESKQAYRLDALTNENVYINGVCVATYIDTTYFALGEDYAYVYFKLPELKGRGNVATMPELDVELSGYEANSVANDVTLSATENYGVTDVEFSVRVLVNGRMLDVADVTTKFNVTSAYALIVTVKAGANYTFIGYDETTLKVKDFGELKITDLWISEGGSTAIISCNLPSLMGTHAHMYANFISCDDEHHHRKCVVCNQFFDLGEHVYSNNADKTCNACGYERELQVTSINFSLVNFGIGKEVEKLKVISAQENTGFDWSNARYSRNYTVFCSQSNDFNYAAVIQKYQNGAFLPDLYYWLIIYFSFDDDWRADYLTNSDITIDGVGSPLLFAYDDEGNSATIVFALPQLTGKNTLVKVEDVEFNFVGYNLGSVINNTSLTVVSERGIAQRSRYLYENGRYINDADTLFSADKKYTLEIELLSFGGYTFYGADLSTIVINGVGELISYEYGAGYGTLKLKYSLPSLASEHEHDFSVWETDGTHHWKDCSLCGIESTEKQAHVYDDKLDTTCNTCSYVRLLPVQKLTITLQGYKVGNKLSQLQLNCNDWNFKKYGDEFILSSNHKTIFGVFSALPSSTILLHETTYYLVIRIADSSSSQIHDIENITENDIELVGYGKPDQLMIYDTSSSTSPKYDCFAIYVLTTFEAPHSHSGEWHDEVPATCVSTGVKGYGICDTCGEKYDAEGKVITELTIAKNKDNHAHGLTKVDGVAATASSVGNITYYYCSDCGKYYTDANGENETTLADTVLAKLAPTVTSGNNVKWTKKSNSTLTFTSNALKADFIGVTVDGVLIDAENYAIGNDELTITLNSDFMKTLSVGKHTISIKSQSGEATATFFVKNAKKGISVGGWIGVSLGGVVVLAGAAFGVWFFIKKRKNLA